MRPGKVSDPKEKPKSEVWATILVYRGRKECERIKLLHTGWTNNLRDESESLLDSHHWVNVITRRISGRDFRVLEPDPETGQRAVQFDMHLRGSDVRPQNIWGDVRYPVIAEVIPAMGSGFSFWPSGEDLRELQDVVGGNEKIPFVTMDVLVPPPPVEQARAPEFGIFRLSFTTTAGIEAEETKESMVYSAYGPDEMIGLIRDQLDDLKPAPKFARIKQQMVERFFELAHLRTEPQYDIALAGNPTDYYYSVRYGHFHNRTAPFGMDVPTDREVLAKARSSVFAFTPRDLTFKIQMQLLA
jgi:hypothetical protein